MNAHLKEVQNGNRTSYSQYVSRWNAPYDEDEQENIRANDGNKEKRTTTVEEERFGPDETSREGAWNFIDYHDKLQNIGKNSNCCRNLAYCPFTILVYEYIRILHFFSIHVSE